MAECLIAQLVKTIGKNGETTYNAVLGNGRLEVRQRTEKPNEYDLWWVGPTLTTEDAPAPYVGIPHIDHQ